MNAIQGRSLVRPQSPPLPSVSLTVRYSNCWCRQLPSCGCVKCLYSLLSPDPYCVVPCAVGPPVSHELPLPTCPIAHSSQLASVLPLLGPSRDFLNVWELEPQAVLM